MGSGKTVKVDADAMANYFGANDESDLDKIKNYFQGAFGSSDTPSQQQDEKPQQPSQPQEYALPYSMVSKLAGTDQGKKAMDELKKFPPNQQQGQFMRINDLIKKGQY